MKSTHFQTTLGLFLMFTICCSLATAVVAEVPSLISYQGHLLDSNGDPVDQSQITVAVRLFSEKDLDTPIYEESIGSVDVDDGYYTFEFGRDASGLSAALDETQISLEVLIDGQALSPRQRLNAVPFALKAASGGGPWMRQGSVVTLMNGGDSIGVGTNQPRTKLHINGQLRTESDILIRKPTGNKTMGDLLTLHSVNSSKGNGGAIVWKNGASPGMRTMARTVAIDDGAYGAHLLFFTNPRGTGNEVVERMRIENNGDVGIGTSNPTSKLEVAGTIHSTAGGFKYPDGSVQMSAAGMSLPFKGGIVGAGPALTITNKTSSGEACGVLGEAWLDSPATVACGLRGRAMAIVPAFNPLLPYGSGSTWSPSVYGVYGESPQYGVFGTNMGVGTYGYLGHEAAVGGKHPSGNEGYIGGYGYALYAKGQTMLDGNTHINGDTYIKKLVAGIGGIGNLGDPTEDYDAANKRYVDNKVANIQTGDLLPFNKEVTLDEPGFTIFNRGDGVAIEGRGTGGGLGSYGRLGTKNEGVFGAGGVGVKGMGTQTGVYATATIGVGLYAEGGTFYGGGGMAAVMRGSVGINTNYTTASLEVAGREALRVIGGGTDAHPKPPLYIDGASDTAGGDLAWNPAETFHMGTWDGYRFHWKVKVDSSSRLHAKILKIHGGSDVAEPFAVIDPPEETEGCLLVIDSKQPGKLRISSEPYDKRLAGVVSGAGDLKPGLTLGPEANGTDTFNVALSGQVYARASTCNGAIEPGDLLTSSSIPGHAMKASDPARAYGAVVGKAMSPLPDGEGLVRVLVSLQ